MGSLGPSQKAWARLTVDGVESLLVRRQPPPATFDPSQTIAVPA
jgi:hypothetical protein